MSFTPRLALPFLSAGQAQKEVYHNEALQMLDVLVGGCVEEPPRASPPSAPVIGDSYIVGDGATAEWAGKSQSIAAFTSGGWRFIAAREGMTVYVRSTGTLAAYRADSWELGLIRAMSVVIGGQQVVGRRAAPIALATDGATIDAQARAAIGQILTTLREHGLIEI